MLECRVTWDEDSTRKTFFESIGELEYEKRNEDFSSMKKIGNSYLTWLTQSGKFHNPPL